MCSFDIITLCVLNFTVVEQNYCSAELTRCCWSRTVAEENQGVLRDCYLFPFI